MRTFVNACRALIGCAVLAALAAWVAPAPALAGAQSAAAPRTYFEVEPTDPVNSDVVCNPDVSRCSPSLTYRGSPVRLASSTTVTARFRCPEPTLSTWWQHFWEPHEREVSVAIPVIDGWSFYNSGPFYVRFYNFGPAVDYRMYWKCRDDRREGRPFVPLTYPFWPRDNRTTEEWAYQVIGLVWPERLPRPPRVEKPNPPRASAAGNNASQSPLATLLTNERKVRDTVRVQPGVNRLTVDYPHPTQTTKPPAVMLRLSGAARACRTDRLFSQAMAGRADVAVDLRCPPSARGGRAMLTGSPTLRRPFTVGNGKTPIRVSIPVPRGRLRAYAAIEGIDNDAPCDVAPVRVVRRPDTVLLRTTATCRGLKRPARGVLSVGGVLDGNRIKPGRAG